VFLTLRFGDPRLHYLCRVLKTKTNNREKTRKRSVFPSRGSFKPVKREETSSGEMNKNIEPALDLSAFVVAFGFFFFFKLNSRVENNTPNPKKEVFSHLAPFQPCSPPVLQKEPTMETQTPKNQNRC